jgi:hypothetical protein
VTPHEILLLVAAIVAGMIAGGLCGGFVLAAGGPFLLALVVSAFSGWLAGRLVFAVQGR